MALHMGLCWQYDQKLPTIADELEMFREFYAIRAKAEGLMQHPANLPDDRTNQEDAL